MATVSVLAQGPLDERLVERLRTLPSATHHSEVRVDVDQTRGRTRVWLDSNEDDSRLYTPAGAQMDAEFRLSAEFSGHVGSALPEDIAIDFASLGELRAVGPRDIVLRADGRPVALRETAEPDARSGALVFMSTKTRVRLADAVVLATAARVDGRAWGHEFRLIDAQREILRAYLRALFD